MRECGYESAKKDGSEHLIFTAFYEALLGAKGVSLGTDSASRGKAGRRLSYVVTIQGNAYTAVLELRPGDEFEIKLGKKQFRLVPARGR